MMSQSSVLPNLFHPLNILSDLRFKQVGRGMEIGPIPEIISSVDEPLGDSESDRVGNNVLDLFPGLFTDFAGAGVEVDFGDFANQVGESRTDSADGGN